MKLRLDTENKTIAIEEDIELGKLFDTLENILPNGKWTEFTLTAMTITNWVNPIVIDRYPQVQPYPSPYWQPWIITYGSDTNNNYTGAPETSSYDYSQGVFNIDLPN